MATFPKALSRTGVSQVNLVQYRAVKPNLHRIRFGERISTMRTAGNAAPIAPQRQTTIGYDLVTGRIATMLASGSNVPFTWSYLPGSDLKSSLTYPNGLTASWQYDANNQLLQVCNAFPTNVISQYDYTYDAAGRRVAIGRSGSAMSETRTDEYGYNIRGELISAAKNAGGTKVLEYQYQYDDIGNRISSFDLGTNRTYTANNLNQYTMVGCFVPNASQDEFTLQFDDDGNQTLIQTATGIWQVQYNGENRPILWQSISTNSPTHNSITPPLITMSYDRMGRRITKNDQRFVYNGYLQIADSSGNVYVWEPIESVATRPLLWDYGSSVVFYTHDGNKNVSEVVGDDGEISARYEYTPCGEVRIMHGKCASANPWRFSSEYADDPLWLICFNFRYCQPSEGRWMQRDFLGEDKDMNIYSFVRNNSVLETDLLGLVSVSESDCKEAVNSAWKKSRDIAVLVDKLKSHNPPCKVPTVYCVCCSDANLGGGYYDRKNKIEICYNNRFSVSDLLETYLHELIHRWNECNGFGGESCDEAVCDEILSYYYSGGCQSGGDPGQGDKSIWDCVIRRAADSAQDYCKKPGETDDQANYNARKRGWAVLRSCLRNAPKPN